MWQGWVNLILGLWLILSGLVLSLQSSVNMIVVGILAAIFGFWAYKLWQGVVNGILGIWIFLSGIAFNLVNQVNFIVVGIIMGILGVWCALSHPGELTTKTT